MPAFTKAYSGTNKQLVKSAELLNEAFGGDKYTKKMDVNPAAVEHIFEGYFGGMGKTINQLGKTIGMAWNKDDRQWRNVRSLTDSLAIQRTVSLLLMRSTRHTTTTWTSLRNSPKTSWI